MEKGVRRCEFSLYFVPYFVLLESYDFINEENTRVRCATFFHYENTEIRSQDL